MKTKEKVPSEMTILEENRYDEFLQLIKENRRLAVLGLRTNAIQPSREILVVTDKWKVIIFQQFKLSKNNKFYIKEEKRSQIIYGKDFLYTKIYSQLRKITPFRGAVVDRSLISLKEIYDWYKLDFLYPYINYMEGETLTFLKKHKITNFEQYFKIKYQYIPYVYFKKELYKNVSIYEINNLNNFLKITTNPNIVMNYKYIDIKKKMEDNVYSDLISMSRQIERKINLLWSDRRIKEEHDKLTKEIFEIKKHFVEDRKIKVNDFFKDILPKEYELIDSIFRLLQEGEEQKHCVYSSGNYLSNVEKGNAALYSILFNDKRFTLDLHIKHPNEINSKELYIRQFMGFDNKEKAPKELYNKTIEYIKKIDINDIPDYQKFGTISENNVWDDLPFIFP